MLYARAQGVQFAKTAMVGRQGLHLSAEALRKNLSDFGYALSQGEVNELMGKGGGFAEPFLELLGATEVSSFDASDYEGANYIRDFNSPIDWNFRGQFSVVLDGGTLEHIFNYPVAIRNCMEMVELGGHFLGITPTNNFWGHGFYQFSPELFFRIFTPPNGFELARMMIFADQPGAEWIEVTDPYAINPGFVHRQPSYLLIIARKIGSVQIFDTQPQQGGYVTLWHSNSVTPETSTT
jgi:hypothetical protein